jgi:peptidoglycan/LPS O-acetylase OafA/YrhL
LSNSAKKLDYIPGLDGIRALAALLVISTHWPNNSLSLKFGWIGVNIFFVLSGFLITRILLNGKHQSLKPYLSSFFYKRALRIFPVYYLLIIITALLILGLSQISTLGQSQILKSGLNAVKYDLPYYFTYTYNIKLNLRHVFNFPDSSNQFFGHLWSLSLEEQFYLIFPFVVYFSSVNTLKKNMIAIIIICPLIRLWAATIGVNMVTDKYWLGELMYTNTLCQADALAMGAAMALFPIRIKFPALSFTMAFLIWFAGGITCFIFLRRAGYFLVAGKSFGYDFPGFWFDEKTAHFLINIRAAYQYSLINLLAFFLIAPATIKKPLFPAIFQSKPISYLGKISYGIYLFHNPIIAIFMLFATFAGGWVALTANPIIHVGIFLLYLAIVIGLAHISYQYFELKIMHKFRYNHTDE